jgi:HEPN domain-containing protein
MTNVDVIKNWLAQADYDYKSAKVMLNGKRYLYVAFLCQQSVEKYLKGVYVSEKNETPPYTHSLKSLIDALSFKDKCGEENIDFILKLNSYYITSRYGPAIDEVTKNFKKKQAEDLYKKTGEFLKWLKSKLS